MNRVLIMISMGILVLGLLLGAAAPRIPARSPGQEGGGEGSLPGNTLLLFIAMFAVSLVGLIILFKR